MERDELLEQNLRHIVPKLENSQRMGKHYYIRLSVVEVVALQVAIKEVIADLLIKRITQP